MLQECPVPHVLPCGKGSKQAGKCGKSIRKSADGDYGCDYDETKITSAEIIDAVVKAGYGASVMTEGSAAGAGGRSTSGNAGSTGRSAADGKQELQQKLDADARAMKCGLESPSGS